MTTARTFVTFEAEIPDDSVFSDEGDIIIPGGYNVCVKFIEQFALAGCWVETPQQHEYYGWEFTVRLLGHDIWMLLQGGQPWLMIIQDHTKKKGLFRKIYEPSVEVLELIDKTIKNCAAFGSVAWFTRLEYEAGNQVGSVLP